MKPAFWPLKRISLLSLSALILLVTVMGCNSENNDSSKPAAAGNAADSIGVGPVTAKMTIDPNVNSVMAAKGKQIFGNLCSACHKIEAKYVGPALLGVTKRRRPEWIMNMILNPSEMTQKDEAAKELLATFIAQMANQNLKLEDARAVLEYFREIDSAK